MADRSWRHAEEAAATALRGTPENADTSEVPSLGRTGRRLPSVPAGSPAGLAACLAGAVVLARSLRGARRKVREVEARTRAILDGASDAFVAVDAEGRITAWNTRAERLFGWRAAEVLGRQLSETLTPPLGDHVPVRELAHMLSSGDGPFSGRPIESTASHRDGHELAVEVTVRPGEPDGSGGRHAFVRDVSERRRAEASLQEADARLQEVATTDALTGLPNRTLFSDRLDQALALARREERDVGVLFVDLDRFKDVNDTLGHQVGDELLVEVSERLVNALRDSDTVARLGGDEFAVLLSGTNSPEEAAVAADRVLDSFRAPFVCTGVEFVVTASVGVALWPKDCSSKAELLQHADVAMYRAKAAGGGRFEMFEPAMTAVARHRLRLEGDLRRAIHAGEFFLRYHPQVDLESGQVMAAEALLRWEHPARGEVMPGEFISLAEDSSLIVPIGTWVLAEACRQAARWRTELPHQPPLRVAVNVSPRQLAHPVFAAQVSDALADSGTSPAELELEITERMLIAESGPAVDTLRALRLLGVSLAIDDFGTGYSSLAYLRRFPVDRIKLDMSFVAGLGKSSGKADAGDGALAAAAIDLAHALGLEALAEGVETEDQRRALVTFGCEQGQGYLWTRPLRAHELAEWPAEVAAAPSPG